jgi:hypothetical protein
MPVDRSVLAAFGVAGLILVAGAVTVQSQGKKDMPFGGKEDVAFAKQLWSTLQAAKLAGPNRINVEPFVGNEPHGAIQQVLSTKVTIDKRSAKVIVKVNHGGKGATVDTVYANPNKYLGAYTVMFKKPDGYDPENKNWFWAKYMPNGEIIKNPKGMLLAGRVAKGMDEGCIACHTVVGGDNLEVLLKE